MNGRPTYTIDLDGRMLAVALAFVVVATSLASGQANKPWAVAGGLIGVLPQTSALRGVLGASGEVSRNWFLTSSTSVGMDFGGAYFRSDGELVCLVAAPASSCDVRQLPGFGYISVS